MGVVRLVNYRGAELEPRAARTCTALGSYTVAAKIGEGGMGEAYRSGGRL